MQICDSTDKAAEFYHTGKDTGVFFLARLSAGFIIGLEKAAPLKFYQFKIFDRQSQQIRFLVSYAQRDGSYTVLVDGLLHSMSTIYAVSSASVGLSAAV